MTSRVGTIALIGVGTFALAYGYSQTANTSSKGSPANQSTRATDTTSTNGDLSVKGVERSGGGV